MILLDIFSVSGIISLVTLVLLEIVLGIDNIIFIAILCNYLPVHEQQKARTIGLSLAMIFRIILLFGISFLVRMVQPIFTIGSLDVSCRDLILFGGGVFLMYKTIREIIHKLTRPETHESHSSGKMSVMQAIIQITLIDIVFSFDSILTAVGLSRDLPVMITAVVVSMIVMLRFSPVVSTFINRYPTIKILALSFLVGIGLLLVLEALHIHVEKAYIYVALIFSLTVELLNNRWRKISNNS